MPGAGARVADDGRSKSARVTRGDSRRKEHPHVRALAGARDLQRGRYAEVTAGLHEGPGITAPLGIVEVHRQEVATVVLQQGIDADGVAAGEVVVEGLIGQWDQQPMMAIGALDPRLLADARTPFVSTRGRIAGLARFAFPAHRVDVRATAEQAAKERDLVVGRERCRRSRCNGRGRRLGYPPGDAVRVQQPCQSDVLVAQPFQFLREFVAAVCCHWTPHSERRLQRINAPRVA